VLINYFEQNNLYWIFKMTDIRKNSFGYNPFTTLWFKLLLYFIVIAIIIVLIWLFSARHWYIRTDSNYDKIFTLAEDYNDAIKRGKQEEAQNILKNMEQTRNKINLTCGWTGSGKNPSKNIDAETKQPMKIENGETVPQVPGLDYAFYIWDKGKCDKMAKFLNEEITNTIENAKNKKAENLVGSQEIDTKSKSNKKSTKASTDDEDTDDGDEPVTQVHTELINDENVTNEASATGQALVNSDVQQSTYNLNDGVQTNAMITSIPAAPVINGVWYGYNELWPWQTWDILNNCEYGDCSRRHNDQPEINNHNNINIEQPVTANPYPITPAPQQPPLNNPPINSLPSNDLEQAKLTNLVNKNLEIPAMKLTQQVNMTADPKDIVKGFNKLKKVKKQVLRQQYRDEKRHAKKHKSKLNWPEAKRTIKQNYKLEVKNSNDELDKEKQKALAIKGGPIDQKYRKTKRSRKQSRRRSRKFAKQQKPKIPESTVDPVPINEVAPKSSQEWGAGENNE